jgi:hypothetical protein
MGKKTNAYRYFVGKSEGQTPPLGRTTLRWENNIEIYVREQDEAVWTGLIWLRIGTTGSLFNIR